MPSNAFRPLRAVLVAALLLGVTQPALANDCATALQLLKQAHAKAQTSSQASARQLEQSSIYLRRLEAWWKKDAANPTLQASCQAIADGGIEIDDEPGEAMSDEEFAMIMQQFDKAGVPR